MIESLLEMCAKQVANYIYDGKLRSRNYKLDEDLSNLVFQHFYLIDKKITKEITNEICQKFQITNVYLDRKYFDENDVKIIYSQNLQQLEIWDLDSLKMYYHRKSYPHVKYFQIIEMLEGMLNPKSRESLRKLYIDGANEMYSSGWLAKLHKLLPNIECLDIRYCNISPEESIFAGFKNLTKLNISNIRMQSLGGIPKLENLQALKMSRVGFENTKNWMELFELKKLVALDVSNEPWRGSGASFRAKLTPGSQYYPDGTTAQKYVLSNKVLPELKIFDCSFNYMKIELLEKLVKSHPNIEIISLIGTRLKMLKKSVYPHLRILTVEDLRCCLDSLNYYTTFLQWEKVQDIMDHIHRKLYWNYGEQNENDLRDLFNKMIDMMKIFENHEDLHLAVMKCLQILCNGTRMKKFNYNEKQSLIKVLLNISRKWTWETEENQDKKYHIQQLTWQILNERSLIATSSKNVYEICIRAMEIIEQLKNYNGALYKNCIRLLLGNVTKMEPKRLLKLSEDQKLKEAMFYKLKDPELVKLSSEHRNYLCLYSLLWSRFVKYNTTMCRDTINVFMNNLEEFKHDVQAQYDILDRLQSFVGRIRPMFYGFFFTKVNYRILLPLLSDKNSSRQKAAISLLLALYSGTKEAKPLWIGPSKRQRIVKSIMKTIEESEVAYESDKYGLFELIISESQREEAVLCARWVMSELEFYEPRLKRRRLQ